jgi:plasmid stabilization system protein ParE
MHAQNNPQAAEEIVEKIMHAVRMLASFPQRGKQTVGQSLIFISVGSDCS